MLETISKSRLGHLRDRYARTGHRQQSQSYLIIFFRKLKPYILLLIYFEDKRECNLWPKDKVEALLNG